jgi:hypothetical protein
MKSLHAEDVPRVFGLLEGHPHMDWTIAWDRVLRGNNVSKTLRIFLLQRKQAQPAPPSGPGLDNVVVQEPTDPLGSRQTGAGLLHCHSW